MARTRAGRLGHAGRLGARALLLALVVIGARMVAGWGCGGGAMSGAAPRDAGTIDASSAADDVRTGAPVKYVFVVAMENADLADVYGGDAAVRSPYTAELLAEYARATNFVDELPIAVPSEPHYVWMEAGTNVFADHTFTDDSPPSATNSTASTDHVAAQLMRAANGADWMSYQEGLDDQTGGCPIVAAGFYRPRHDPFVFFRDISGSPPSTTTALCVAHHAPLSALATDLASGSIRAYSFITPDLCHDSHGQSFCPASDRARAGDDWLRATLPPIIDFVNAHDGVIFILWDEGTVTTELPFLAVGPHVKRGYASDVRYDHGSLVKSLDEIFRLPILPAATSANDFSDLFESGFFP